ncbi:MAG: aryl-sulfate sulfotransferase, partial [Ignavibacteria bacterium]|nr:aryl-sulfate sulfotransferase [Ignavibacteria bacterium]
YDILDVHEFINLTSHIIDWTHCNSIEIAQDGNLIISTKNFNEITKINRQTGEIIWRLGGERNQFQFINDNRGFGGQHDARVLSNGNIALFDNGLFLIPEYSSYVEYEIDEQNFTATLVRRYSRNGSIFSGKRGGVQELPNGNILISWDGILYPFVSEINPEDSTVYEVKYDNHVQQYRAYKFPWKTNLFSVQYDSLDFGTLTVGDSSSIEVKIYNRGEDSVIINEVFNNEPSFYVDEILPIEIAPHDSIEIRIVFKPLEERNFTDKMNFRYATDTLLIAQQIYVQGETNIVNEVEESTETYSYSLSQNYPNPFNSSTKINFSVHQESNVNLSIYNLLGELVSTLVNEQKKPGHYEYAFNASELPSGIYLYSIKAGSFMKIKKMVFLR